MKSNPYIKGHFKFFSTILSW